jgi:hypothetical protein
MSGLSRMRDAHMSYASSHELPVIASLCGTTAANSLQARSIRFYYSILLVHVIYGFCGTEDMIYTRLPWGRGGLGCAQSTTRTAYIGHILYHVFC